MDDIKTRKPVIRSNKSKGISVIKKKDGYLDRMKDLTKYLSNQDPKLLHRIVADEDIADKLKFRAINHLLNHPKLIKYINTYLNGLYDFNTFEAKDLIFTIGELCRIYGIYDSNVLYFSKYKPNESESFFNLIVRYRKELKLPPCSNTEINALYILYSHNIITDEILNRMKSTLDGVDPNNSEPAQSKQSSTFQMFSQATQQNVEGPRTFDSLTPPIKDFIGTVMTYIQNRTICKTCPLMKRSPVILDTNLKDIGPVDLLFFNLNPNNDDKESRIALSGKTGDVLRRFLYPLVEKYKLTYMIVNCIFCHTQSEKDIPNIKNIGKNCNDILDEVVRHFPPKIKILLGSGPMKVMGIKGGISKNNGKIINDYVLLLEPESVLVNAKNLTKFETGMIEIEQIITGKNTDMKFQSNIKPKAQPFNIPQDKIISRFGPDLTLFNIEVLDENVVYIMKDKHGKKKYLIEPVQFPVFIKSGKYMECGYIDQNMQAYSLLTREEKDELSKKLYYYLNQCTKNC